MSNNETRNEGRNNGWLFGKPLTPDQRDVETIVEMPAVGHSPITPDARVARITGRPALHGAQPGMRLVDGEPLPELGGIEDSAVVDLQPTQIIGTPTRGHDSGLQK